MKKRIRNPNVPSRSSEYAIWTGIKDRCNNPRNEAYPRYGGAGIKMHPLWEDDFNLFMAHMGPKPTPKHTVDRIKNDKGYEPGNVRWATQKEQQRNRTNNKLLTIDGVTLTQAEWAEKSGVSVETLYRRLRNGKTPAEAISEAVRPKPRRVLEFNGEALTVPQWARRLGTSSGVLLMRLKAGWPVDQVVTRAPSQGSSPIPRRYPPKTLPA